MSTLNASLLQVRDILAISQVEIAMGAVTVLTGGNDRGKTSITEAISTIVNGGHDPSLIRDGAEKGEVLLMLRNGARLEKEITHEKFELKLKDAAGAEQKKPKTKLDAMVNRKSFNPISFLSAPREEQVERFLAATPLTVTADQLVAVVGPETPLPNNIEGRHALQVISELSDYLYDQRTGCNTSAREKSTTAGRLREALPGTDISDTAGEFARLQAESRTLNSGFASAKVEHEAKYAKKRTDLNDEHKASISAAVRERDSAIATAVKTRDEAIAKAKSECEKALAEAEGTFSKFASAAAQVQADIKDQIAAEEKADAETINSEWNPKISANTVALTEARNLALQQERTRVLKEEIERNERDAEKAKSEADRLTAAMDALQTFKEGLLDDLPVEGVEIRKGELYLNGHPFFRVNLAGRTEFALKLAAMTAGDLGLICVDGLECLDPENFDAFLRAAAQAGKDKNLQWFITRVTAGPLEATTYDLDERGELVGQTRLILE